MGLLNLFYIASTPVLKVLILTAFGFLLALDPIDVLETNTRNQLNNLIFYVFSPALVSSTLAKTITFKTVVMLWFMPFNILVTYSIGSVLGWILIKITRAPQQLKGLILGCCAAGNVGYLPLIIIPAVCKEEGSPFGAPDFCDKYGTTYASLSMALGAFFLWSYVYNIVRISLNKVNTDESKGEMNSTAKDCFVSVDQKYEILLSCTKTEEIREVPMLDKIKQCLKKISRELNLKALFAPSTTAAIIGFMIGVVPSVRNNIIGGVAPLRVVEDSASMLGDAAIPSVTLLLGANLLRGLRGSGVKLSLIGGIVVVRYVLLPVLGIAIVKVAVYVGMVHSDPLYEFVLLLHYAVPPAMNIGTITQLFGAGESECSVVMLWTYGVASVSLTVWSTLFMTRTSDNRLTMKILDLFTASLIPALNVLLLTALGLFLALDKIDILGEEARKHLNNVTFYVFTPALIGSSLAKYMTNKSIGMLWFMPINILITFVIGSALGWILLKITRAPRNLWGLVLGCCAAGNIGNMLFIVIPAVCKERGSPFGNANFCHSQGMAYSSLSMAIGAIYMWSYVYNIVRLYSSTNSEVEQDNSTEIVNPVGERAENLSNSRMGPLLPLNECSVKEDGLDQFELSCPISEGGTKMPFLERVKKCFQTFAAKLNLKNLLSPSTIGAIVGFMVGVIPRLQKVLVGENAPLRVVEDSTTLLGEAAIPTVTLIVGANLLRGHH